MHDEIRKRFTQIVLPVVRIYDDIGNIGSGFIISSKKTANGVYTYIITNSHIIEPNIEENFINRVSVDIFVYDKHTNVKHIQKCEADIIELSKSESGLDLALLRLTDNETIYKNTINLCPYDESDYILMSSDILTVSFQNGLGAVITKGILSHKNMSLKGFDYHIVTTPCYYGSSGGAVFIYSEPRKRYELIGVLTSMNRDETKSNNNENKEVIDNKDDSEEIKLEPVVYHLAFAQPIELLYKWLDSIEYLNILSI